MSRSSSVASDSSQSSLRRKRAPLGEASPNTVDINGSYRMSDVRPSKMPRSLSSSSMARPTKRRLIAKGEMSTFVSGTTHGSTAAPTRPVSVALRPPTPPRPHQALEPKQSPPKRRQSFLPTSKSSFSLNAFQSHIVAPSPIPAMFAPSPAPVRDREPVRRLNFSGIAPPQPTTPRKLFPSASASTAPVLDAEHNPFAVPTPAPGPQPRSMIPTTPGGRRVYDGISKFGHSPAPPRALPLPTAEIRRSTAAQSTPSVSRLSSVKEAPPIAAQPAPVKLMPATPKRIMGDISRFNTPAKPAMTAAPKISEDVEMADMEEVEAPKTRPLTVAVSTEKDTSHCQSSGSLPHWASRKSPSTTPVQEVVANHPMDVEKTKPALPQEAPRQVSGLPRAASRQSFSGPSTRSSGITTRGQAAAQIVKPAVNPPSISALPVGPRRPGSRPVNAPAPPAASADAGADAGVRRRPSYPSSLGLGAGPSTARKPSNSRVVSNPLAARSVSNSGPSAAAAAAASARAPTPAAPNPAAPNPAAPPARASSSRSVSAPPIKPRASLSMSSRRDGGFSSDANKSFVHLDQLLSKLQVMPERTSKPVSGAMAPPAGARPAPVVNTHRTMGSLSAPARTRLVAEPVTEDPDVSIKASSLEALVTSKVASGCLRGITAFVDVRTEDGDDTSMLYGDMLRQCGARVLVRPSESCTHIVYKSGKPATLSWYRRQKDPKPYIVGAGWVTKCKEEGRKVAEDLYAVQVEDECMFQKRRKSMEPKQLAMMTAGNLSNTSRGSIPEAYASSLAQARRKSLLYAPRVGSPLKKVYKSSLSTHED